MYDVCIYTTCICFILLRIHYSIQLIEDFRKLPSHFGGENEKTVFDPPIHRIAIFSTTSITFGPLIHFILHFVCRGKEMQEGKRSAERWDTVNLCFSFPTKQSTFSNCVLSLPWKKQWCRLIMMNIIACIGCHAGTKSHLPTVNAGWSESIRAAHQLSHAWSRAGFLTI